MSSVLRICDFLVCFLETLSSFARLLSINTNTHSCNHYDGRQRRAHTHTHTHTDMHTHAHLLEHLEPWNLREETHELADNRGRAKIERTSCGLNSSKGSWCVLREWDLRLFWEYTHTHTETYTYTHTHTHTHTQGPTHRCWEDLKTYVGVHPKAAGDA